MPGLQLSRAKLFFLFIEFVTSAYVLVYLAIVNFSGSCTDTGPSGLSLTCNLPWVLSTVVLTVIHLLTMLVLCFRRSHFTLLISQAGDILADIVVLTFYIEIIAAEVNPDDIALFAVNLSLAVLSIVTSIILMFWHRIGSYSEHSDEELAVSGEKEVVSGFCESLVACGKAALG